MAAILGFILIITGAYLFLRNWTMQSRVIKEQMRQVKLAEVELKSSEEKYKVSLEAIKHVVQKQYGSEYVECLGNGNLKNNMPEDIVLLILGKPAERTKTSPLSNDESWKYFPAKENGAMTYKLQVALSNKKVASWTDRR
jgi:hypothetical protein